jgi:hypothetical protein
MQIPSSDYFTPIPLEPAYTHNRRQLDTPLILKNGDGWSFNNQSFTGIPFELGSDSQSNVILLDKDEVTIDVGNVSATYIIFAHAVEDKTEDLPEDLASLASDTTSGYEPKGNRLGNRVSEYQIVYSDGTSATSPILRRFAIQQSHIAWGASAFASIPNSSPFISAISTEEFDLERKPRTPYGKGETRHNSGRDTNREHIWLYALPNPHPDKTISQILCTPKDERSIIYGITTTQVNIHPLRPATRQKLELSLPEGIQFNSIGELDDIDIDLGYIISARAKLEYDKEQWFSAITNAQPTRSDNTVVIEYSAHPNAKLYLKTIDDTLISYSLSDLDNDGLVEVQPSNRIVRIKVIEAGSQKNVAVRIHLHGVAGEYLPPRGNHRKVNPYWFEDNYGEFVNSHNQYAYIHGDCEVEVPMGEVFIEITRGHEIKPIRTSVEVTVETDEFTFELERVLNWREKGWVSADTHVHFLSPQTALLEGAAEGINVVNLLASQWGEMFSNVTDFDGHTTIGAKDFGGDGEFLVRVGTENRMQVLGHISLLGYSGQMIHPLCSGGPSESALGDAVDVTMADWAQSCIDQNGLVVLPHAPDPQCERAADIVLGLINAIEMKTHNSFNSQISPYGIADWYRYLNLGYQVPVVGGSDKMAASHLLGGICTYTQLNNRVFTYDNWMEATRAGNTFVTVGPLAELIVEGLSPGQQLDLPKSGGTINVTWRVESASMPIERVEIIVGGLTAEATVVNDALSAAGSTEIKITESTWVALRVRGSHRDLKGDIAAHTSAVQVQVEGQIPFSKTDAMVVLEQIEGAIAFIDTLAPRPEATRYKKLRATVEAAHNQMHQRMHQQGVYHEHTPVHNHTEHHEH